MKEDNMFSNKLSAFFKDKWVIIGLLLNILFKAVWYLEVASKQKLYGDESSYFDRALELSRASGWPEAINVLFSHQHRMPGTSLIIWLSQQFDHPVQIMRLYMVSFETLLFIGSSLILYSTLGRRITRPFIFFIALCPMIVSFSFNVWGDLIAGWLLFSATLLGYHAIQSSIKPIQFIKLLGAAGACWGLSLYFRPSMIFFGPLFLTGLAVSLILCSNINSRQALLKFTTGCLVLGLAFSLTWGPWMACASYFKKELTYQPGQNIKKDKWLEWTVWALSPNDVDWGYRRGKKYDEQVKKLMEERRIRKADAIEIMRDEVLANTTLFTYLSAFSRNVSNVLGNENQFLAGAMWVSNIHESPSIWFPRIKRSATRGGHRVKGKYVPNTLLAKGILLYNSYWYHFIIASVLAWAFVTVRKSGPHADFVYFIAANILCILSMSFYHPGHGRYILSLLPCLTLSATLGFTHYLDYVISLSQQSNMHAYVREALLLISLLLIITILIFMP